MPSNVKLSVAARNAFANAVADLLDAGAVAGHFDIRTGSPPTNLTDASSGTLLASPVLSDPAYADAASGTAASNPIADAAVLSAGDAGYFRAYHDGASDTAAVWQGTAGEATDSPDLPFDESTFSLGGKVCIQSANIVIGDGSGISAPAISSVIRLSGANLISWSFSGTCSDFNLQKDFNFAGWTDMASPADADRQATDSSASADGTYRYRIRARFDATFGEWSNEVEIVVSTGGTGVLTSSDFTYLGSFRFPGTVNYGSGNVATNFNRATIAYRGKGGVDRIVTTSANNVASPDGVYEVTVPTLLTSTPYNQATVYKAWGNVYGLARPTSALYFTGTITVVDGVVTLAGGAWPSWFMGLNPANVASCDVIIGGVNGTVYDVATRQSSTQITLANLTLDLPPGTAYELRGGGSIWTNGLFIDPDDWDTLYYSWFQNYASLGGPCIGQAVLDDGTTTATTVGCWFVANSLDYHMGGGICKIPAAFVAANTPGKPYMAGFGGKWMSTVDFAARGPSWRAIPIPDINTHAHLSSLPSTEMMRHGNDTIPGEQPATRPPDYSSTIFGICETGTSTTQIVLDAWAYANGTYAGREATIYSGPGSGPSGHVMTWVSGRTYTVEPDFAIAPVAGVSQYELSGFGANGVIGPIGDVGYWTYGDWTQQATVWVDGTKRGILVLTKFAINRQFYGPGGVRYENAIFRMRVYDPDDVAAIIAEEVDPWAVQPISEWDFAVPNMTFPLGFNNSDIMNMTLDQAGRRLFIIEKNGSQGSSYPDVHVYSIAGSN